MLERFFAPYAEYTLRTKLTEAELGAALKRECGHSFANWKKWISASWHERETVPFRLLRCRKEILLRPLCRGRNSARGEVHLTMEKAPYSDGTIIHVSIRPQDMRWFCVLWLGFLSAWTVGVLCSRNWMFLGAVPVMLGGFFLILHLCRSMGEQELPLIRRSFESLIKRLEETRHVDAPQCT